MEKKNSYFLYCEKRNKLFCHIEKNGCESIRYLILNEENHENPQNIWNEHINKYFYTDENIYKLQEKNPNVILISRDPYSRIISGFNDKVLGDNFNYFSYSQKIMNLNNNDITKRINFEEFINYIVEDDIYNIDNHFKPQYIWFNQIKIFKNIKIFKLEDTSEINFYLKQLNFNHILENYLDKYYYSDNYRGNKLLKKDIPYADKLSYDIFKKDLINNNFIPLKINYFNDNLKKKFINKYKEDFDIFNYSI